MSVNRAELIGYVGKDPETRKTNNEAEVAFFSLATSSAWKDKTSGEKQEKTEWHRIVVFSPGLVNVVKKYVKKGTKLYVSGAIQTRKWVDKNGIDRNITEIVLNGYGADLEIFSGENKSENSNTTEEVPEFSVTFADDEEININDDIPF